jgi:predicted transcriptional regulator
MSLVKERMSAVIQEQPEDASYEEVLRELAFEQMIERGLEDSRAGRVLSSDEVRARVKSWRK